MSLLTFRQSPSGPFRTVTIGDVLDVNSHVFTVVSYAAGHPYIDSPRIGDLSVAGYHDVDCGTQSFRWLDRGDVSGVVTLDFTACSRQRFRLTGAISSLTIAPPASPIAQTQAVSAMVEVVNGGAWTIAAFANVTAPDGAVSHLGDPTPNGVTMWGLMWSPCGLCWRVVRNLNFLV